MEYNQLLQLPCLEFLEEVLKESPKNCTWMKITSWLMTQFTSIQIAEMYCKLLQETFDIEDESDIANNLRDKLDIFWYATSSEEVSYCLEKHK